MEHASKNGSAAKDTAKDTSKNASLTLEASTLKLWKIEDGTLVLRMQRDGGTRKVLLGPPRRALPLSDPDRWIVLSDVDGVEVGVLDSVDELDEGSQAVLREALRAEYRIERIVRIIEVEREPLSGQTHWRVEIAPNEFESSSDGAGTPSSTSGPSSPPVDGAAEGEADAEKSGRLEKVASLLSLGRATGAVEESSTAIEREFTIAGQEDVQTARYPHIFIVDTERRRYEIPNCEALDTDSRKAAERFF